MLKGSAVSSKRGDQLGRSDNLWGYLRLDVAIIRVFHESSFSYFLREFVREDVNGSHLVIAK